MPSSVVAQIVVTPEQVQLDNLSRLASSYGRIHAEISDEGLDLSAVSMRVGWDVWRLHDSPGLPQLQDAMLQIDDFERAVSRLELVEERDPSAPTVALFLDDGVTYRQLTRVLYSVGQSAHSNFVLAFDGPSGPGFLGAELPTFSPTEAEAAQACHAFHLYLDDGDVYVAVESRADQRIFDFRPAAPPVPILGDAGDCPALPGSSESRADLEALSSLFDEMESAHVRCGDVIVVASHAARWSSLAGLAGHLAARPETNPVFAVSQTEDFLDEATRACTGGMRIRDLPSPEARLAELPDSPVPKYIIEGPDGSQTPVYE